MKSHLHVLVAACLMLAAPNAFAGGNLTCPELQETEEFSSSKFQPPGQRGAKAPDPNAVPMRIRWEYEPAGLEENPHDHQLHRKCIMRMRLDIRIDRRIASDIAAIFQPYSICEAKISTGVGGWLARGEHSLQADTHLQVKIKKCGTHIWTECHDVWKCSKTRRPYTIHLGELDVTLRALLLASAPEGVGQLDVDSVARVGDVKYTLPGDIGARVPQAVVDLIVPDAFDSALE
ncbi:TPA: hypothetical protein ACGY73_000864 [Stenotrophomonas maltophilia]